MIKTIEKLIRTGKGDKKILQDILSSLKNGEPLYLSDYRFIQDLIEPPKETQDAEKSNKKKTKKLKEKKGNEKYTISKKASTITSKDETPLKILKNRLASGEITLEEFKTLKKVLTET